MQTHRHFHFTFVHTMCCVVLCRVLRYLEDRSIDRSMRRASSGSRQHFQFALPVQCIRWYIVDFGTRRKVNRLFHKELFNSKAAKPCTLRFSQVAALQHRLFLVVFVINNPKEKGVLAPAICELQKDGFSAAVVCYWLVCFSFAGWLTSANVLIKFRWRLLKKVQK